MNFDEMYPSKFLKADDLGDKVHRVTIKTVEMGKMQDGKQKPIVSFVAREKQLVLNKTNAKKIAGTYGKDTARWVGKQIQLFATTTEYAGDEVECIRVKIPADDNGKEQLPTAKVRPTEDDPRTTSHQRPLAQSSFGPTEEEIEEDRRKRKPKYDEQNPPPHDTREEREMDELNDEIPF